MISLISEEGVFRDVILADISDIFKRGKLFTYSSSFLLTVKFLCLQFLKALIRRTFPL